MGYSSINIHLGREHAYLRFCEFSHEPLVLNVQLTLDNPAMQIIKEQIFTNASISLFINI